MRKLKLSSLILMFTLMFSNVSASTQATSVPVVDGSWTFIGVSGVQTLAGASTTTATVTQWSAATSTPQIVDGVGTGYTIAGLEVPTWDGNWTDIVTTAGSGANENSSNYYTPRDLNGTGQSMFATVGIMVLGQDDSSTTDALDGLTNASTITFAGMNFTQKDKNQEAPVRTMYVKSSASLAVPDVKIFYQADYEGDSFFFTTESNTSSTTKPTTYYQLTFNRAYTYTSPVTASTAFVESGGTTSGSTNDITSIMDAFDSNLSDNNISSLSSIQAASTAGSLRAAIDGNLTVLTWDSASQEWRAARYDGNGSSDGMSALEGNDFSTLTVGQGYWIKFNRSGGDQYVDTAGFVLGDTPSETITYTLNDGWNMLAFHDDYLTYSVTGMYLPDTSLSSEFNITGTYGTNTLSITNLGGAGEVNASVINKAIDGNNSRGFTNLNIKAIAYSKGSAGGVLLVSTRKFSVQAPSAPLDLTGQALSVETNGTASNFYRSKYGAFTLMTGLNTDFALGTGHDANVSVVFPQSTATDPGYAGITTSVSTSVSNLETAMGTNSGGSINSVTVNNYAAELDMNFDGTKESAMMASNFNFYVKDATLVRTFQYDNTVIDSNVTYGWGNIYGTATNPELNTTGNVYGKTGYSAQSSVIIDDDNLTRTVANINAVGGATEVNATKLDADTNTTFMIFYTGSQAADDASRILRIDFLEEGQGFDVMTETAYDSNTTSYGALSALYYVHEITAQRPSALDTNYSFSANTADMKYTPYFAEQFVLSGPLYDLRTTNGVEVESMITAETAADASGIVSWKQVDTTKDASTWYDVDEQYELFWTEKEKGYWVYLNSTTTVDFTIDSVTFSGTTYQHFNNPLGSDFSATTGTTRNHINTLMTVTTTGLASGTRTDEVNNEAHRVTAEVNGITYYLEETFASGATTIYSMYIDSHETHAGSANQGATFDYGTLPITVTIADGNGKTVSGTYELDYEAPVFTSLTAQADGTTFDAVIANGTTAATTLELYDGDINDSKYGEAVNSGETDAANFVGSVTVTGTTTAINMGSFTSLGFPTGTITAGTAKTAYDAQDEQYDYGFFKDIRVIARDTDAGNDMAVQTALYSSQRRLAYAPVYSSASILSHSSNAAGDYDTTPIVHDSTGAVDTTWVGDDGVQIQPVTNGDTVTLSYKHEATNLDEGVVTTRTLRAGTTNIGVVMFATAYNNKKFYITHTDFSGSTTYVGYFNTEAGNQYIDVVALQGASVTITNQ